MAVTTMHEMCHWSGHKSRLDGDQSGAFGSKVYSFEEFIAEIGSAFVSITLNIPTELTNHASYIGHWLAILKEDKRAIFRAGAAAHRAADFILQFDPEYAARNQPESPNRPSSDAGVQHPKITS